MNKTLRENTFNKRANKHTPVVRYYKAQSSSIWRCFMRIGTTLYMLKTDGEWMKVSIGNHGLRSWAHRVFGMEIIGTKIQINK